MKFRKKEFIFLIIILNFSAKAEEFCNNKYCFNVTGNPTSGQSSCSSGSWPLEFPDKEASDFFNSKADPSKLYKLNLKFEFVTSWEWTTRRMTSFNIEDQKESSQWYACLKNKTFYAKYFNDEIFQFICEVNEGCAGNQDPSCFEVINPSNERKTWYEAMNYCVERNKRLAVFEDDQVPKQLSDRLDSSKCYWIGLSRLRFTWPHYNKPLTYSSWLNGFPHPLQSSGCFFVRNNKWEKHNCVEPSPLVCMRAFRNSLNSTKTTKAHFSTFPINTKSFSFSDKSETSPTIQSKTTLTPKTSSQKYNSIGLGVGLTLGILFLIFILLLLIFLFRKGYLQSLKKFSFKKFKSNYNMPNSAPSNQTNSPIYATVSNTMSKSPSISNLIYVDPKNLVLYKASEEKDENKKTDNVNSKEGENNLNEIQNEQEVVKTEEVEEKKEGEEVGGKEEEEKEEEGGKEEKF